MLNLFLLMYVLSCDLTYTISRATVTPTPLNQLYLAKYLKSRIDVRQASFCFLCQMLSTMLAWLAGVSSVIVFHLFFMFIWSQFHPLCAQFWIFWTHVTLPKCFVDSLYIVQNSAFDTWSIYKMFPFCCLLTPGSFFNSLYFLYR